MSTVVIVDDDSAFLSTISQILTDEGYVVRSFESIKFTEAYQNLKPDVLLVDVWFGDEKDGLRLSQALANHRQLHKVPLVLISSDNQVVQYAQQVKAADYLIKPFAISEMLSKIRGLEHIAKTTH
jgi:DNA-binding NtrC family response regulator